MSELDSVISVDITANTVTPTRAGFGTALVLTYHTRFAEEFRIYTDTSGMADDGFTIADPAYGKAVMLFSQNPAPEQVIVGRLPAAPTFTYSVSVTNQTAGQHIKLAVFDPTTGVFSAIDRTIPGSSTYTAEATAVAALLDALPGITATSSGAVITVGSSVAGARPVVHALTNATAYESTAAAGYDTELTALQLVNDDWYAVTIGSDSDANVQAVATWVAAQKKLFFYATSDSREIGGSSVTGAALKTAARRRTVGLWAENPAEFGADGWLGVGLPQAPGSITWALKTIQGLSVKQLTATQKANLDTNNVNHYMTVAGINVTRNGKVASGEYVDIVHGMDALEADIKESVFTVLVNNGKVPFTGGGLDLISNAILGALKRFEGDQALLVTGSSLVIMPDIRTLNPADLAARRLVGVKFTAKLQGAIQTIAIKGTLSL